MSILDEHIKKNGSKGLNQNVIEKEKENNKTTILDEHIQKNGTDGLNNNVVSNEYFRRSNSLYQLAVESSIRRQADEAAKRQRAGEGGKFKPAYGGAKEDARAVMVGPNQYTSGGLRLNNVIDAGLYGSAASYTNLAGWAGNLFKSLNDAAYDSQHNQQYLAAQNSKDYWESVLHSATNDGDRKRAQAMIDRAVNTMNAMQTNKEQQTKPLQGAYEKAYEKADELQQKSADYTNKAKDGLGAFGQLLVDAGVNGTQMLGDAALNVVAPGAGLVGLGARSFGSSAQEARQDGADFGQQTLYGGLNAATEVLTEKMFDGLAGIYGKSALADTKLAAKVGRTVDKALGKLPASAKRVLSSMGGEALEELVAGAIEPAYKSIYGQNGYDENTVSDIINAMLVGGILGGLGGGVETVSTNAANKGIYAPDIESARSFVDESLAINPNNRTAHRASARLQRGKNISGETVTNLVEQNTAPATDDAYKRLNEMGEESNVYNLAKIIAKQNTGYSLSEEEQATLDGSKYGKTVAEDMRSAAETNEEGNDTTNEQNAAESVTEPSTRVSDSTLKDVVANVRADGLRVTDSDIDNVLENSDATAELGIDTTKTEQEQRNAVKVALKAKASTTTFDQIYTKEEMQEKAIAPFVAEASKVGMPEEFAREVFGSVKNNTAAQLGVIEAYKYGSVGVPFSEISKNGFAADMSAEQRAYIYNKGVTDSKLRIAQKENAPKVKKRGSGKVVYHTTITEDSMSDVQKLSKTAIESMAEAFGTTIHLYDTAVDKNGKRYITNGVVRHKAKNKAPNGFVDTATGEIYLDMNAGGSGQGVMLYTLAHEYTHIIRKNSPAKFRVLSDFLFESYEKSGQSVESLIRGQMDKAKRNGGSISYDGAYEEVVADAMEQMLTDPNAVERIRELKAKDKTLWEKLKDLFKKLVDALKNASAEYSKYAPDSLEATLVSKFDADVREKLAKLYAEAFVDASENEFTGEAPEVTTKFAGRTAVEETKDLIAVHNMTERNMLDALKLGGLPMPSIAIVRATDGHNKYGPISVVFGKETIDPQFYRANKVYGGDAYTPTAPRVEYEADEKVASAIRDKFYDLQKKFGRETVNPLYSYANDLDDMLGRHGGVNGIIEDEKYNTNMMKVFLADTGKKIPDPVYTEKVEKLTDNQVKYFDGIIDNVGKEVFDDFSGAARFTWLEKYEAKMRDAVNNEMLKEGLSKEDAADVANGYTRTEIIKDVVSIKNYIKNGATTVTKTEDYAATMDAIRKAADKNGYREWLNNLFAGAEKRVGIYNGKDPYTSTGNRRSFSALHYEYTLENIVKAMKENQDERGGQTFGVSASTLQSVTTPQYGSVEEIKSDSNRLAKVDDEQYEEMKKEIDDRLYDIISEISKTNKSYSDNSFVEMDNIATAIVNTAKRANTASGIVTAMKREGYAISNDIAKELQDIFAKSANMPTEYFEAKPQRAVGWDEVRAVIVPRNISADLKAKITDAGMKVVTYKTDDDADRTKKLNSIKDVKFSDRDSEYMELAKNPEANRKQLQKMVDEAAVAAGYTVKSYHGTPNTKIKAFKPSSHVGTTVYQALDRLGFYNDIIDDYDEEPDVAELIMRAEESGSKVFNLYVKSENPLRVNDLGSWDIDVLVRKLPKAYPDLFINADMSAFNTEKDMIQFLKSNGYDSFVYENWHEGRYEDEGENDAYVLFDSNQIKSANPVTYDDNGNVIPLSERFNSESDDIRYSDRDSEGNQLSAGQQEYFKDSKAVDKEGNLLVMYRGGNEDFTVFDRKKSKPSNLYGRGFYFTNSETHAKQYGNAKPYYLNIKNPVTPGTNDITKKQMRAFIEAVADDEDYGIENYGYGATVDSVLDSVWGKDDFAMLQDVSASAVGDLVASIELFNDVNGTEYDGIILPTETVTFRSNQAKLTNNTKPTEDEDIRYSEREIIGASGKNYGMGVYLDSTLLENLTDKERKQMVAERVKELAGNSFTAYDNGGNPVIVKIAENGKKFKNKNGDRVSVNKDLATKFSNNHIKQEVVVLADEAIETAKFKMLQSAKHKHGWLDNKGNNMWDIWTVYVQEKNNAVWEATLNIANSKNGEKYLYDIDPIKMVEGAGKSATTTTTNNVPQTTSNSQANSSDIILSDRDTSERNILDLEKKISDIENKIDDDIFGEMSFDESKRLNNQLAKLRNDLRKLEQAERKASVKTSLADIRDNLDGYRYIDLRSIAEQFGWEDYEDMDRAQMEDAMREFLNGIEEEWRDDDTSDFRSAKDGVYVRPIADNAGGNVINVKFSDRGGESFDTQSILTNAGVDAAKTETERDFLKSYFNTAKSLAYQEQKLTDIRDEIRKTDDKKEIAKLQREGEKVRKVIEERHNRLVQLEQTKALRDVVNRERDKAVKAAEKRGRDALKSYRERANAKYDKAVKHYQESRKQGVESRKAKVLRESIGKTANDFRQMILHPTDSRYAPIALMQSCLDVALMLDTSGAQEGTKSKAKFNSMMEALRNVKDQYDELANNKDNDYASEYDPDFAYMVKQLSKRINGKPVRDLTLTELEDIHNILHDIKHMLKDAKFQIGKAGKVTNYSVGESIIRSAQEVKPRTKAEKAIDATFRQTGSTLRNVRRIAQYDDNAAIVGLFNDLNEGIKKKNRFMMEADKMFDEFLGERFSKAASEVKKYDTGKRTIEMTEMEAIQLVMTWEREMKGKTNHLMKDGITIPDHKLLKKGRYQDAFTQGTLYSNIEEEEIMAIARTFDDWAARYKDTAKKFFNDKAKNAINEATMQIKHRLVAMSENYIPIEVDKNYIAAELEGVKFDATIEGMGMLKSVVEGASNPIIIRGVNNVIENHINRVGQVYGLAVPIRNFNKAFGIREVGTTMTPKKAIGVAWGDADVKLIEQAITDLQTPRSRANDALSKILRTAQGKFVEATLLSNISVTIKQAASYSTAGLYLSQKALAPYQGTIARLFGNNNSKFAKELFAEIDAHTPEHYIRRKGMSMQEISTITQDKSKVVRWMDEKLPDAANPLKWIQNMDVATTAALWLASKKQVELDGTKPTDANYWDKVTALYEKVIEDTQPMYDVLHRPEVQKTTNEMLRNIIMFRTQPLQNSGILYNAAGELAQAKKSGDTNAIKKASKQMRMAVGSQVASLAVFATMTFLAYAVRNRLGRYKDDEEELTVMSVLKRILGDMGGNGAQLIVPLGGDVISGLVEKKVTGSNYGGEISVPVIDRINDYISDADSVWKDIAEFADGGKDKLGDDSWTMAQDIAGLFGIPASNVYNIFRGVVGNVTDIAGNPLDWATDEEKVSAKSVNTALENGHYDTAQKKIDEFIEDKVADGKTEKEATQDAKSSVSSYWKPLYKEAYANGDKEKMADIRKTLKESGLFGGVNDIIQTTNEWMIDYDALHSAIDSNDSQAYRKAAVELASFGVNQDKSQNNAKNYIKSSYDDGNMSDNDAINRLVSFAGKSREDAEVYVSGWRFNKEHPDIDWTDSQIKKYNSEVQQQGISVSDFDSYLTQVKSCKGTDADGDGKTDSGSKKEQVLRVIDSMPISNEQKDFLYYLNNWSATTIYEAPWH